MLVGKISRRVSLVHYPEPKEVEELNPDKIRQLHVTSSGASMPNHQFASSGQSSWRRNSQSTLEHSSYTQSSRYKSFSPEGGEPSKHSKRRRAHEPNHSTDHSLGRHSEVTSLGSSERSHQEKLKRKGKSWVRLLPARLLSLYYSRAASCGYAVIFKVNYVVIVLKILVSFWIPFALKTGLSHFGFGHWRVEAIVALLLCLIILNFSCSL